MVNRWGSSFIIVLSEAGPKLEPSFRTVHRECFHLDLSFKINQSNIDEMFNRHANRLNKQETNRICLKDTKNKNKSGHQRRHENKCMRAEDAKDGQSMDTTTGGGGSSGSGWGG